MGAIVLGVLAGALIFLVRTFMPSLFTVNQNERAVITSLPSRTDAFSARGPA